ncbi:integrase, partial [Mesorhizobium sp. LSHC422A00]
QKTVRKWRNRTSAADLPTGPRDPKSTVLSTEEEAVIVAFRRYTLLPLDDCLYALQPTIPHLSRSSLHRCLQRHGIGRLPDVEGDKPARKKFKAYPIGYFHIDVAEVRTEQGKLHMFVAIDRTSKFAFVELHEKATTAVSADFLRHLLDAVPYKIHTVLTDNGIQFTTPGAGGSAVPGRNHMGARLRTYLRQGRYRPPNDKAKAPMDQRPGRTHEPHDQGCDRQTLLLREP